MNKDYLKHLIRTDCFGLLSGVAKSFNKAVVDLAVKGENNFTTRYGYGAILRQRKAERSDYVLL